MAERGREISRASLSTNRPPNEYESFPLRFSYKFSFFSFPPELRKIRIFN